MSFKNTHISNSNKNHAQILVDALREGAKQKVDLGEALNDAFTKDDSSYPTNIDSPRKKLATAIREGMNRGVNLPKAIKHAEKLDKAVAYQRINNEYLHQAKDVSMEGISLLSAIGIHTKGEEKTNKKLDSLKKTCQNKLNKATKEIGKNYSVDKFDKDLTKDKKSPDTQSEALTAAALRKQYRGY